jgi:hypothetical protein
MAGETAGGAPVAVKAWTDKKSVSIGDKIRYSIEVESDKDVEIQFPDFGENLAEFAIRDFGSSKGGFFGSRILTQWYILDIYETGTFTIPETVIKYRKSDEEQWKEVLVDSVGIEVLSALDNNSEIGGIRDIKGPVSLFSMLYVYIILAVIAVLILIAAIVLFLKKRNKSKVIAVPPRPAHEIAYEAFERLLRRDYLKTGKVQEYYFDLSNIVRQYIENRFQLRAPEMTTDEFLATLKNAEVLNSEQKGLMKEFLSHCDMVKFAKYLPDEKETGSSYESAKKFIEETKVMLTPDNARTIGVHVNRGEQV